MKPDIFIPSYECSSYCRYKSRKDLLTGEQTPPLASTKEVLGDAVMLNDDIEPGFVYGRPALVEYKNVFNGLYMVDSLIVRGQPSTLHYMYPSHLRWILVRSSAMSRK